MVYERGTCTRDYDVCFNGRLHTEMCPPLYSYNGISCVPSESCGQTSAKCQDGDVSNVDGSSYVECVDGEYVTKFCPVGHLFQILTKTCEPVDIDLRLAKKFCDEASRKSLPDCSKYQECVKGRYVDKQCPDNMLFDKNELICKFSWEATCDDDSCVVGEKKPDPKDCGTYYTCDDGTKEQQSCGIFTPYYDPVFEDCYSIFNKHCERKTCNGDWVKVSADCSEYTLCKNGYQITYSCPAFQKYNNGYCSLMNKCEHPNSFLVLKAEAKGECTNGETRRVYGRCTEYQKCVNKHWKTMHCPKGQNFQTDQCENKPCPLRAVLNYCNLFMQPESDKTYPCPFGYLFDSIVRQCVYTAAARCADGECVANEIINHPTDCTKYKTCDGGKWKINSCPALFHFDINTKECRYWKYQCQYETVNCSEGATKPDPSNCKEYEKCIDDSWRSNKCWFWQHFDSKTNSCATFKYQCYQPPTTSDLDNDKTQTAKANKDTKQALNTYAGSQILASKCAEGEVKAVENTCRWYTECINGEMITKKCSPCMNFNPDPTRTGDKVCDYVWRKPCKAGVTDPAHMTTAIPATTTTTTTPKPVCKDGTTRGVHGDCKKYQQCIKGQWATESCKVWGKFDSKSNSCVYFALWSVTCA
ncbi:hypothetical protein O3M35_005799 [Rhynocoris fuscipes]